MIRTVYLRQNGNNLFLLIDLDIWIYHYQPYCKCKIQDGIAVFSGRLFIIIKNFYELFFLILG